MSESGELPGKGAEKSTRTVISAKAFKYPEVPRKCLEKLHFFMSLNKQYLFYLSKYPLLTKLATSGVLAALNEMIASGISGDTRKTELNVLGSKVKVRHVLSPRILQMVFYGACIATPISHNLYGVLNKFFQGKLTPKMKLLQLLTSLCTVTPCLSAVYVAWLLFLNGYKSSGAGFGEIKRLLNVLYVGVKRNFPTVYRTSLGTTIVAMTVAQNFLPPELWVVFFSLVYFVVGTIQNTRFKLKAKRDAQKKAE